MPFSNAGLLAEINADGQALGLAALVAAGNDQGIADALNLPRAGAPYKVDNGVVASYLIINALVASELATRTAAQLTQVGLLTGAGQVDTSNANVQAQFVAIFDNATAPLSRAALIAVAKRAGSRAEVLFGSGVKVTSTQVATALGRS